jgi:ABC-2 type transport system permease protein
MSRRAFLQLVVAQATLLRRNTSFWLASIFTAVISMAVFGWLFNPESQAFDLALVDLDRSEASRSLVEAFSGLDSVELHRGDLDDEMDALSDGQRSALVVVPEGFGEGVGRDDAAIDVHYDNSDLVQIGYVTSTIEAVVNAFNEKLAGRRDVVLIQSQAVDTKDVRFVDFLTPGMMGMTVMWVNLGVGFMLVTWREQGILRRLGVTPLRPATLIASQAVSFAMVSLTQVTIILAMGGVIFDVDVAGSYIWLAVTVLLGVAAMLSLGYIIASVLRTVTSVNAAVNLIAFPMIFLGGSYFPLETPPALAPLVNAIPLTHLNEALRAVINQGDGPGEVWVRWAVLAGWAFAGYLISMRFFRWQ